MLSACAAVATLPACQKKEAGAPGDASAKYSVTFSVVTEVNDIGALQFDVDYSGQGGFIGLKDGVECEVLLDDVLSAFTASSGARMTGAIVDVKGFNTPLAVAKCNIESTAAPTPADFKITTTDASNIQTTPIDPFPELDVSDISPLG